MTIPKLYKILVDVLKEYSKEEKDNNPRDFSQMDIMVNEFSKNESSLKIVMDMSKFQLLAISDNLEELFGYTKEDFLKDKIFIFFRSIRFEHILSPITYMSWGVHVFKQQTEKTPFEALKIVICGINIKPKNDKEMRILIRIRPIELAENGYPKICIITYDNITHLLKPNTQWWGRVCYGEDFPNKYHILSTEKKYEQEDILSSREIDVLKLIADGLESKEIGKLLYISSHTVDNHRRNAVQRTGARDTTALVQLCRMCGMF
jgi:DNA-binding CsgD family transcriptional regulator